MNRRHARERPRGLTLVECLAVIAVIGLLAALLVPAIQSFREAARRALCTNNLRQMGLALHGYASALGSLPPCHNANDFSVHVAILPFAEMKPLYDSFNFGFAAAYPPIQNLTACSVTPGLFLCPSESVVSLDGSPGWTTYCGNLGSGVQKFGYNGAFGYPYTSIRLGEFTDGFATTALMSEWTIGRPSPTERSPRRATFVAPSYPDPDQLDDFAHACREIDAKTARTSSHVKGSNWTWGEFIHTFYNHVLPPNQPSCLNGNGYQIGAFSAGSQHPGGANVLFADGHVRFVTDRVAPATWRALGSRNGREVEVGSY